MSKKLIPITPSVLRWAIKESGLSEIDVAHKLQIELNELQSWENKSAQPGAGHFRKLVDLLKRQATTFFLPEPPQVSTPTVQFRHPHDSSRTQLNFTERRYLREANRLQKILSWVLEELNNDPIQLPLWRMAGNMEEKINALYPLLKVEKKQFLKWRSPSAAFKGWREILENAGIFVFCLPLEVNSVRGFSLWDDHAPIIIVNTSWSTTARIFTLFHEFAHLLTRTNSACSEACRTFLSDSDSNDEIEKWCEQFAASFLVPADELKAFLRLEFHSSFEQKIQDLDVASKVADYFRVSLRAATLRLIDQKYADWPLYFEIPPMSDRKVKSFGRSEEPRTRSVVRREQYGLRVKKIFSSAIDREVVSASEVLGALDAPYAYLEK